MLQSSYFLVDASQYFFYFHVPSLGQRMRMRSKVHYEGIFLIAQKIRRKSRANNFIYEWICEFQ